MLEKGKDPVSFANVIVLGTKQGTMTDENGNFVIAGVPVGTYQVKLHGDRLRPRHPVRAGERRPDRGR